MQLAIAACVVLPFLIVIGVLTDDQGGTRGSAVRSPENNLTTIEIGYRPDGGNSTLLRIASLLDSLETDCTENTRVELADYTANTMEILRGEGIKAAPSEILQDILGSADLGVREDCSGLFALYATLRTRNG